jgi:hypothetical protein
MKNLNNDNQGKRPDQVAFSNAVAVAGGLILGAIGLVSIILACLHIEI